MSAGPPLRMRAARLHGVGDLRVEDLERPVPAEGEILVAIEMCGVCPTDARKFHIGVNHGTYPLNPGHEWAGRVVEVGGGVEGFAPGDFVFGDTYAGYAEFAAIATVPKDPWSCGALHLPEGLPLERAVFVEPLADCLHAVHDQARLSAGDRVVVVGAGAMGLQIAAAAGIGGGRVLVVEPQEHRRDIARRLGAEQAIGPEGWAAAARDWSGGDGVDVVVVAIPRTEAVAQALGAAAPGARIVAFAGFGDSPEAVLDLNLLHYLELSIVGSEWVGTPPNQRRERYRDALDLLASGRLQLEALVERTEPLEEAGAVLAGYFEDPAVKTVLRTGAA